ncbi:hypothetical protein ACD661_06785 [Legionella lytica]|uniref:Kynureninase n=1 Tax=Legionella lytica TaxID=96232 RepID=A0ABW8D8S6_9GAMM
MKELIQALTTNPDEFIRILSENPQGFSLEYAAYLDEIDPLKSTHELFAYDDLIPFAGHSLGPVFKPAVAELERINQLQAMQLHEGHFSETKDASGNWFDCDIEQDAISAMQAMLGFSEPYEFLFTQEGLSANLGRLLDTFYRPTLTDWQSGRTAICHLGKEFFSDQAIIESVLKRGVQQAKNLGVFANSISPPKPEQLSLKILPDEKGLYSEEAIIAFIKKNVDQIQIIHLSDVVFSTGQRLDLQHIFTELKDLIAHHQIIVGLDLAHTVGNRTLMLCNLPVTYAVGCSYKHLCGSAGSGFGIYVNKETDLEKYPPLQGWKAAVSEKVFAVIDGYDAQIMMSKGAWAFRCSNPSPVALAPVKTYAKAMGQLGWDKLQTKSECLTRYMRWVLQQQMGKHIEWITPEEPAQRGAMLVFRLHGIDDVSEVETLLKQKSELGRFEIDVRPPNNIRVTAHYGYTRFADIYKMILSLKHVICLLFDQKERATSRQGNGFFDKPISPERINQADVPAQDSSLAMSSCL